MPRRHHYVAQMYLAGFANDGTKEGHLWVADFRRKHHWRCKPDGIAHSRDFYRVDIPDTDPFVIEKAFADLEGEFSSVIRNVLENQRFVGETDLSLLINFLALQMMKTPAMRNKFAKPVIEVIERVMDLTMASPERYYAAMKGAKEAGYISEEVSYEEMKRSHDNKGFIVSTSKNWDVKNALEMADAVLPILHERNWTLIIPENEDDKLICSDHPVVVHWADEKKLKYPPGLGLSGTSVFLPIGSNMALCGLFESVPPIIKIDTKKVASYNNLTLLNAYEQVFSREASFKAINKKGKIIDVSVSQFAKDWCNVLNISTITDAK